MEKFNYFKKGLTFECMLFVPLHSSAYVTFTLHHLLWLLKVSNEGTYQEVVRATCGNFSGLLCEVAIAVYTFGTCIAFFIVIGDQLDRCEYIHSYLMTHTYTRRFSVLFYQNWIFCHLHLLIIFGLNLALNCVLEQRESCCSTLTFCKKAVPSMTRAKSIKDDTTQLFSAVNVSVMWPTCTFPPTKMLTHRKNILLRLVSENKQWPSTSLGLLK